MERKENMFSLVKFKLKLKPIMYIEYLEGNNSVGAGAAMVGVEGAGVGMGLVDGSFYEELFQCIRGNHTFVQWDISALLHEGLVGVEPGGVLLSALTTHPIMPYGFLLGKCVFMVMEEGLGNEQYLSTIAYGMEAEVFQNVIVNPSPVWHPGLKQEVLPIIEQVPIELPEGEKRGIEVYGKRHLVEFLNGNKQDNGFQKLVCTDTFSLSKKEIEA